VGFIDKPILRTIKAVGFAGLVLGLLGCVAQDVAAPDTVDNAQASTGTPAETPAEFSTQGNPTKTIETPSEIPDNPLLSSSKTQVKQNDLLQYDCDTLWKNFEPLKTTPVNYDVSKKLKRMGHGVRHDYYPTPFDFDNDGDEEIILVDNVGYSQFLGGQGSHMFIVKILNFNPAQSLEENLLTRDIDVNPLFFANFSEDYWHAKLVSKIEDLPRFKAGVIQFGTIESQIVIKINSTDYVTKPPKGWAPASHWRPYNLLGRFEDATTLNIMCLETVNHSDSFGTKGKPPKRDVHHE